MRELSLCLYLLLDVIIAAETLPGEHNEVGWRARGLTAEALQIYKL